MPLLHPLRLLFTTAKSAAAAHLFAEHGLELKNASGPSMMPTLEVWGEWLLVSKTYRFGSGIRVGDIVSYEIPIAKATVGVKRVLGMPGDYVLVDSPGNGDTMIQIPKGHCWLVGDNLTGSRDSRLYGPVPLALVRGKVIAHTTGHLWSLRRLVNPLPEPDPDPAATSSFWASIRELWPR